MRLSLFAPLALFALVALPASAEECAKKSYGAPLTLSESTPVATLLDHPQEHAGKSVRVEGTVIDVCAKAGCWLEIQAGEGERSLRVKVKDGEIVFPTSARGHRAVAEGTFESRELDRAAYLSRARHLAEEQGRKFDEASVVGDGPFQVHQLAGRAAEICE